SPVGNHCTVPIAAPTSASSIQLRRALRACVMVVQIFGTEACASCCRSTRFSSVRFAPLKTADILALSVAAQAVALIRLKTLLPFFPFSLEFPPGPPLIPGDPPRNPRIALRRGSRSCAPRATAQFSAAASAEPSAEATFARGTDADGA